MNELLEDFRAAWPLLPDERQSLWAVVVWLRTSDWQDHVAGALRLLPEQERHRASRQRDARDQQALVLAYAFHRLVVARLLGGEPASVPLYRDAKGCPRLQGLPDIGTSLSHGRELLAIAVSSTGPVGVDIEPAARASTMPDIAAAVLHPDDGVAPTPSEGGLAAWSSELLRLWVRKEAVLKAAGIGLECPMDRFPATDGSSIRAPMNRSSQRIQVQSVDAGEAQVLAVATVPGLPVHVIPLQRKHERAPAAGYPAVLRS